MRIKAFFEEQKIKRDRKIVKQWYTTTKGMRFQTSWLDEMSFGNAEGERDKKLYDSFIETRSIKEKVHFSKHIQNVLLAMLR